MKWRCCYITVDSGTTALQNGACIYRCISKQMHYKTPFSQRLFEKSGNLWKLHHSVPSGKKTNFDNIMTHAWHIFFFFKVWWQDATLFVYFSYFFMTYIIHTFVQSHLYNTFIRRHSLGPLSISSSLESSVGRPSPWFRAENQTWACLTASRRDTNWAAPHPKWLNSLFSISNNSVTCSV